MYGRVGTRMMPGAVIVMMIFGTCSKNGDWIFKGCMNMLLMKVGKGLKLGMWCPYTFRCLACGTEVVGRAGGLYVVLN
jgi:hypothetical protein